MLGSLQCSNWLKCLFNTFCSWRLKLLNSCHCWMSRGHKVTMTGVCGGVLILIQQTQKRLKKVAAPRHGEKEEKMKRERKLDWTVLPIDIQSGHQHACTTQVQQLSSQSHCPSRAPLHILVGHYINRLLDPPLTHKVFTGPVSPSLCLSLRVGMIAPPHPPITHWFQYSSVPWLINLRDLVKYGFLVNVSPLSAVPTLNLPVWNGLLSWSVLMLWSYLRIIPCH